MSNTTSSETSAKTGSGTVSVESDDTVEVADTPEVDPNQIALPLAPAAHNGAEAAVAIGTVEVRPVGVETTTVDPAEIEARDAEPTEPTSAFPEPQFFYGPTGRRRSPVAVVFLCIITFGLYGLVWHNRVNRDLADFDPHMRLHTGRTTWAVTIPWLLGLLTTLAGAARIGLNGAGYTLPFNPVISVHDSYFLLPGLLAVPYLTLFLPFAFGAVLMTSERIRIIEELSGVSSDVQIRPAAAASWLLLPVLGPIVLITKQQRRVNANWDRISPPPGRRRR